MQPILDALLSQLVPLAHPTRVIQYNEKYSQDGQPVSLKLCVITPEDDADSIEHKLYVSLDCNVPFDILVYNAAEWNHLIATPLSFAKRINETGRVLYETNETH